jgi:unsaturated rhamnogalacturonyl hydrolase
VVGEDLTSRKFEVAALTPIDALSLSRKELIALGNRISSGTWNEGLNQWSWGEGVFLLGLVNFLKSSNQPIEQKILDWYEYYKDPAKRAAGHVNNVAPGSAAAALIALGHENFDSFCSELLAWVEDSKSCTRAMNGAIEHWPGGVWADTCYMVGIFLSQYGIARKDPEMVKVLGTQIIAHAEYLQNPTTRLFAHGTHDNETIWSYWGRGNAWMALAAVEYLEAVKLLNISDSDTQIIENNLMEQFVALVKLLPDYGIWDVLVDGQVENKGILEISASAGIAAAILRASQIIDLFPQEIESAGLRVLGATISYINVDGIVTRVSAGTVLQLIPFGYSVIRSDRMQLWGQGLELSAIAAALNHPAFN